MSEQYRQMRVAEARKHYPLLSMELKYEADGYIECSDPWTYTKVSQHGEHIEDAV